jgi:hypothetical protein
LNRRTRRATEVGARQARRVSAATAPPGDRKGRVVSLVYRFYNTDNSAHFFTSSKQEKYNILVTLPQLRYEGIAWTTV